MTSKKNELPCRGAKQECARLSAKNPPSLLHVDHDGTTTKNREIVWLLIVGNSNPTDISELTLCRTYLLCSKSVYYAASSKLLHLTIPSVSWFAMTEYRPSFSLVIDVLIDKSLSFNSRLVTYIVYVLWIHSLALSLSILITTETYCLHLYRRLWQLFYSQISRIFRYRERQACI